MAENTPTAIPEGNVLADLLAMLRAGGPAFTWLGPSGLPFSVASTLISALAPWLRTQNETRADQERRPMTDASFLRQLPDTIMAQQERGQGLPASSVTMSPASNLLASFPTTSEQMARLQEMMGGGVAASDWMRQMWQYTPGGPAPLANVPEDYWQNMLTQMAAVLPWAKMWEEGRQFDASRNQQGWQNARELEQARQAQQNWQTQLDVSRNQQGWQNARELEQARQAQQNWLAQFLAGQGQQGWQNQFTREQWDAAQGQQGWENRWAERQADQSQQNWLAQFNAGQGQQGWQNQFTQRQADQTQQNWLAQFNADQGQQGWQNQFTQRQADQTQQNWLTQFDWQKMMDEWRQRNAASDREAQLQAAAMAAFQRKFGPAFGSM